MSRRREEEPKPDVGRARAQLARIKARRAEVAQLVGDLDREKRLNDFTANVVATFREGR